MADVAVELAPIFRHGAIIALEGDLGAGKTAFARALIRNLSGDPALDVPSPTFTLVQTYDSAAGPIWHFDFYRLKHPEEVFELGWEDAISDGGIIIMEWAQRIAPLLPQAMTNITITPQPDGIRILEVHG
jgi:tRNA threonylcarbamoyladenosine biosynthesis protein TsaE